MKNNKLFIWFSTIIGLSLMATNNFNTSISQFLSRFGMTPHRETVMRRMQEYFEQLPDPSSWLLDHDFLMVVFDNYQKISKIKAPNGSSSRGIYGTTSYVIKPHPLQLPGDQPIDVDYFKTNEGQPGLENIEYFDQPIPAPIGMPPFERVKTDSQLLNLFSLCQTRNKGIPPADFLDRVLGEPPKPETIDIEKMNMTDGERMSSYMDILWLSRHLTSAKRFFNKKTYAVNLTSEDEITPAMQKVFSIIKRDRPGLLYQAAIFQACIVRTWNGTVDELTKMFYFTMSTFNETTTMDAGNFLLEDFANVGMIKLGETSAQPGPDLMKRILEISGDVLSIVRGTSYQKAIEENLSKFFPNREDGKCVLKALKQAIWGTGDLHLPMHVLEAIHKMYFYGFIEVFCDAINVTGLRLDALKSYQLGKYVDVMIADEIRRRLCHLWLLNLSDSEAHSMENSLDIARGFQNHLEKLKECANEQVRFAVIYVELVEIFELVIESVRQGDAMALEGLMSKKLVSLFAFSGKGHYKEVPFRQMENLYGEISVSVREHSRRNRFVRLNYEKGMIAKDDYNEQINDKSAALGDSKDIETHARKSSVLSIALIKANQFMKEVKTAPINDYASKVFDDNLPSTLTDDLDDDDDEQEVEQDDEDGFDYEWGENPFVDDDDDDDEDLETEDGQESSSPNASEVPTRRKADRSSAKQCTTDIRKVLYELIEKSKLCDDAEVPKKITSLNLESFVPSLTSVANLKKSRNKAKGKDGLARAETRDEKRRASIEQLGWAVYRGNNEDINENLPENASEDQPTEIDTTSAATLPSETQGDNGSMRGKKHIDPKMIVKNHPLTTGWKMVKKADDKTRRQYKRAEGELKRKFFSEEEIQTRETTCTTNEENGEEDEDDETDVDTPQKRMTRSYIGCADNYMDEDNIFE